MRRFRSSCVSWLIFGLALAFVAGAVIVNVRSAYPTAAAAAPSIGSAAGAGHFPGVARPVADNCSGGRVYLTFDDGPGAGTQLVLERLEQLHLQATFFLIGDHVAGNETLVRREMADGDSLQNHTFHHSNLVTGVDVDNVQRSPWGDPEIDTELVRATDAIVAAGVPRPTLYRPPYGSVDRDVDAIAQRLGLRLVMPWSDDDRDNIIDSHDTEGVTAAQVVQYIVPRLKAESIIALHDSEPASAEVDTQALQAVADRMNALHLCSSVQMRPDATGGVLNEPQQAGVAKGD
jgi:peptidoglycan/xylan/chitin deacetylase (PgdA/CDA1 family)